jgi:hypothetical protein
MGIESRKYLMLINKTRRPKKEITAIVLALKVRNLKYQKKVAPHHAEDSPDLTRRAISA